MGLLVKIGADLKDFERKMNRATKEIEYISKKMESIGKDLTTKVTVPIIGIGAASVKIGADFEAGMSEVKAITGAVGDDFDALKTLAKDLGSSTKFSAREAADGMKYLGMAGFDTKDIISSMPAILDLAAASGSELAVVSDIVSDAMTAFGLSADKTSGFADLLASTSRNANTNVELLGESFKYVAPVAGALGYSAEDTAFALGLMANSGIKASQAGTSLRSALTRMANGTGEAGKVMDELGLTLTDSEGNMKALDEVIHDLRDAFSGMTEEQKAQTASTLFGQNAMSGMLSLINASSEDILKLTDATKNYDGVASEMASTMQDNLQGQLTELKSALEGVAIQISEILIPIVSEIISKVQEWVQWFSNLDSGTQETIIKIAGLIAAIGPVLIITAKVISIVGKLSAGIKLLTGGIGGLGGAFTLLTGPIGIVVAAIVGVIAMIAYLWKTNEDFRDAVMTIWETIKDGITTVINSIRAVITATFGAIQDFLDDWGEEILAFIDTVFSGIYEVVKLMIELVYEIIKNIMGRIEAFWEVWGETIMASWSVMWSFLKEIAGNMIGTIRALIEGALEIIQGIFTVFIGLVTGDWSRMWDGMRSVARGSANSISGILNGVIGGFEAMINGVSRAINRIPKIKIPSWVPGLGGRQFGIPNMPTLSLPRVPSFDVGTDYVPRDMLALIHKGEKIIPKKYNPDAGAGEKERLVINNHFELNGLTIREDADIEKISRELYKMQQKNRRGILGAY